MNEKSFSKWERRIQDTAVSFAYPPTPDVTHSVRDQLDGQRLPTPLRRRRLAWAVLAVLLFLAGLMAVPPVRAAVWRIIRAGAITIFVNEPVPTGTPAAATAVLPSPTPQPADEFIFDLATPATLAEAQAQTKLPLRLPTYPVDLGEPDRIYLQETNGPATIIFVWLEPDQPDEVRLSLYQIEADDYAYKGAENIEMTAVNGRDGIWLEAPHYFRLQDGRVEPWLFVEGNVLIWWTGSGVTYRLESGLSLEEAVRIADSLQ